MTCKAPLHYHPSGMTCRSCGFSIDHDLLLQSKCASCRNLLEESEKTTGGLRWKHIARAVPYVGATHKEDDLWLCEKHHNEDIS